MFATLRDQSTAVKWCVFVTFVHVDPTRSKHDLVTGFVNHLPDTITNDRNFSAFSLFEKCVVEQLATRGNLPLVPSMNPNGLHLVGLWVREATSGGARSVQI